MKNLDLNNVQLNQYFFIYEPMKYFTNVYRDAGFNKKNSGFHRRNKDKIIKMCIFVGIPILIFIFVYHFSVPLHNTPI